MIYIVIPARSGSKSIPNKNLQKINGFSLIEWSVDISIYLKGIFSWGGIKSDIIFTTDSDEYIKEANGCSARIMCDKRPEYLCTNTATDFDYLDYCRKKFQMNNEDLIVLLRPTTPIRNSMKLADIIDNFIKCQDKYDSLRTMHEVPEPPQKMFCIRNGFGFPYMNLSIEDANKPKETFEKCYHPNGYCDILKVSNLEQGNVFGERVYPWITDFTIEVDSQQELDYLRYLHERKEK